MRYAILTFALLLAFSGNGWGNTTFTKPAQGFELIGKDGSLRARVFANTDNVLLDFPIQQRGYLFRPGSYVYLNHAEKTYCIHSYDNLAANLLSSPGLNTKTPTSDMRVAGFSPTGETDRIAGFTATKIVSMSHGKVKTEIWVCEEVIPAKLRAVGQEIRNNLPENYWADDNRVPTLFQAILVFGLPLRIIDHENESSYVEAVSIKDKHIPRTLFYVPVDYRQAE